MTKLVEITTMIEEYEGTDALEKLQYHENEQVYNASVELITTFFSDDEEMTGLEPKAESDVFVFGAAGSSAAQNQHIHF